MDTTDFSCDSDFDDLDVIRKRLSLSLNSDHSAPNTSDHMEDDAPAGLRVMVVDDNTACLFITSIMLKRFNYEEGVPKRILEYMRIPGLTRENVASHLQKYRIFVKNLVENNRDIEPSTVKSLASRAFHASFATDAPTPISLLQVVSQKAPKYSFGSFQPGSEDGNFQGPNTQNHTSHLSASMVAAGFQLGESSTTPMNNNNNKGLTTSAQQPRSTTRFAAANANKNAATFSPARSILNMSMGGGRSGRGTMRLVHQQNLMRWSNNIQSTGPLNTSTRTVFESGNFQRLNNNPLVANMGTTANIGSSSVGNSTQPITLNSTNFMGIQIINDNTNSSGTLHIRPMVSTPSNDNNMDYSFTNRPASLVMEVPGLIPESYVQSSYSAIEEPNSNPDYLNSEPSSIAPVEVSNPIWKSSCMNTSGFTAPQDEASFGGGIIPNANHESISPQEAPAPLVQEAQHPEQDGEDVEDLFKGLCDLLRNDSYLGSSLHPLMDNYLNIEPSSIPPVEVSYPIRQPSFMNTNGFTAPQDEATFGGGIISNANKQEETQVPTLLVAPTTLVQEAQQTEQAGEEEKDPFEGLYDLIRNDSNPGSSFLPLMDNEDFAHFFQDFEQSNTDQGGSMYGGEDFLNQP